MANLNELMITPDLPYLQPSCPVFASDICIINYLDHLFNLIDELNIWPSPVTCSVLWSTCSGSSQGASRLPFSFLHGGASLMPHNSLTEGTEMGRAGSQEKFVLA